MTRFSFKSKIIISCAIWTSFLFVVCFVIDWAEKNQANTQKKWEHSQKVVQSISQLLTIMVNMETGIRGYLLSGEESYLEPFAQSEAKFDQEVRVATDLISGDAELASILTEITQNKVKWMETTSAEMIAKKKAMRGMITVEAFLELFKQSKGKAFSDQVRSLVDKSLNIQNDKSNQYRKSQEEAQKYVMWALFIGMPISIIMGFGLMFLTTRKLDKNLQSVLNRLIELSENIFSMSSIVAQSAVQLSDSSAKQAGSIETTSVAMTEISSIIKKNADRAMEANNLSTTSSIAAEKSEQDLNDLFDAISEVQSSSKKIDEIVGTIEDIAFQTNLLALNAAVEAARAGEQGRGFAVVAEAVRNLSQNSSGAAKKIATLVKDNTEKTNRGVEMLNKNKNDIVGVLKNLKSIAALNQDVSTSGAEQSQGVEDVTLSMNQLDEITSENNTLAKNSTEAAQNIDKQAQILKSCVGDLLVSINGKKAS